MMYLYVKKFPYLLLPYFKVTSFKNVREFIQMLYCKILKSVLMHHKLVICYIQGVQKDFYKIRWEIVSIQINIYYGTLGHISIRVDDKIQPASTSCHFFLARKAAHLQNITVKY